MEDRGIDCVITATEVDNVFVLGFETIAEAALFRLAWASEVNEVSEATPARALVH
jgi:hypothetical protein